MGIEALMRGDMTVRPLQELHAMLREHRVTHVRPSAVRPVLFRLGGGDAEKAHEFTLERLAGLGARPARPCCAAGTRSPRPVEVFGVRFPNPVGLAAGMDKNGVALPAWPALGFGFVEVGTVTAQAAARQRQAPAVPAAATARP